MITFTFEGRGAGTLDGLSFAETEYIITAVGDTDDLDSEFFPTGGTMWYIEHQSVAIWIDGLGTFDITEPTMTYLLTEADPDFGTVGFGYNDVPLANSWIEGASDAALLTWDMQSSIGPITTNYLSTLFFADPLTTSDGLLDFDPNSDNPGVTFTAVVIPAPMAGACLLLSAALARRRRRR